MRRFASELVRAQVAVIVILDSDPPVIEAKAATSTIPVVFKLSSDPIQRGLITSLSRPGGNMTGVAVLGNELMVKRLQLLFEMAPRARTIAYLTDPRPSFSEELTNDVIAAAHAFGRDIIVLEARDGADIDAAFATLVERGGDALLVGPMLIFSNNSKQIVELAAHHSIPAISGARFLDRWGIDELWRSAGSAVSTNRLSICRADSPGHQTCRSTGTAAHHVRFGDQPQDCQGTRPHHPGNAVGHC
jgi:putative ABC transport system substrate-binding protein